MHLYLRLFYDLLRQQINFEWTLEHQTFRIKILLTEQISNTIPDSDQQFCELCDASNFGIGAIFLQSHKATNQMNLIWANLWLRLSILMRKCTVIKNILTEFEFLILGSKHSTVLFTDQKTIIFLFTRKSKPNYKVYRFQLI